MRFEPHPYQDYAIKRIVEEQKVGLFLDMGLGKTVITLSAINELMFNRWTVTRCLVIAPKKVAEATWTAEAAKWDDLKHLRVIPVLGSAKQRAEALSQPGQVYVINRENVVWLVDHLRSRWDFDMVVLDESSSFKNPQSRRFRAMRSVLPRIQRLVLLTGTPAPNGLQDLWAQIYLLDGGQRLGRTISAYRDAYFTQDYARPGQMYRTYTPQEGAEDRVKAALADICVSMQSEDYLSLPEFIEEVVPVVLDSKAKKVYQRLEREMLLDVDGQTITAGSAAVLNGKLLQLCGGAVYDNDGVTVPVHDCKIEAFMELIEQLHEDHALVFYWFQHDLERLTEALSKTEKRVRVYRNAEDAEAWNAGQVDILLAHPVSCGYGLNLQEGGHHAVWFSLPNWALEVYQQANKRLHRQGQRYPVICHLLVVQGGVDEDVIAALRNKGDKQAGLMQALRARIEKTKG